MSPVQGRGGIFISYRRDEAGGHAGRLSDRLRDLFGADRVFMDVDSIAFGDDFTRVIEDKVSECEIMLVLIGRDWVSATDSKGRRRRIDSPDDWVRVEVEAALQRDIRVVPVLVGGAAMPHADYLPPSLRPLARRQAFVLSHTGYQSDLSQLVKFIRSAPRTDTPKAVDTRKAVRGATYGVAGAEIGDYDTDEVIEAEIIDEAGDEWEAVQGQGGRSYEPYESRRFDESEHKSGPASKDRKWRLDLLAGEGANKAFHLSSNTEVYEIVVRLTSTTEGIIKVDGGTVVSGPLHENEYRLKALSSEVGTPVMITVSQGGPHLMRIDRVVVRIGAQDLWYRSEEWYRSRESTQTDESTQSSDRGPQRMNEWISQAVETFVKRRR